MKQLRLAMWLIWLALSALAAAALIAMIYRLLISGATFFDELGGTPVSGEEKELAEAQPTVDLNELFGIDCFDAEAVETPEPEELVTIPVEKTPEELMLENETVSNEKQR